MSKHEYTIELAHGAQAWCAAHAWPSALEARVRGEIAHEMTHGLSSVDKLMLHTFEWDRDSRQEFICTPAPDRPGVLIVDTCTREDGEKLTEGPFAGKVISMPVPDSE